MCVCGFTLSNEKLGLLGAVLETAQGLTLGLVFGP